MLYKAFVHRPFCLLNPTAGTVIIGTSRICTSYMPRLVWIPVVFFYSTIERAMFSATPVKVRAKNHL